MSRLPADRLRELARLATRDALRGRDLPPAVRGRLVLGELLTGRTRTFQLYVPAERPEDAAVISRVVLDPDTGEVLETAVFLPLRNHSESSTED